MHQRNTVNVCVCCYQYSTDLLLQLGMASKINVNDRVKIDGNVCGRVLSVVQTLGAYHVYGVTTDLGQIRTSQSSTKRQKHD